MPEQLAHSRWGHLLLFGAIAALAAASFWQVQSRRRIREQWDSVPLPSIGAELLSIDGKSIVRRGTTRLMVVRFASPVEFVPHHFKTDGLEAPETAEAWAATLRSPVVFNAGQFDDKLAYLGWLKSDGTWLSEQRKPAWKALLVSGPAGRGAWGRIVDLDDAEPTIVERYKHVVQSMMLVDATSKIRVRDTELTASRCVAAEDQRGRILIILVEGATTLGDLARWLPSTSLGVVRAMNLDGGSESQLAINTRELKLAIYGQFSATTAVWSPRPGGSPLPTVVAVRLPATSNLHERP
jgi:hypothetical protein